MKNLEVGDICPICNNGILNHVHDSIQCANCNYRIIKNGVIADNYELLGIEVKNPRNNNIYKNIKVVELSLLKAVERENTRLRNEISRLKSTL